MSQLVHAITDRQQWRSWFFVLVVSLVLLLAFFIGSRASVQYLAVLVAAGGGVILLIRPVLGVPLLILTALLLPIQFSTGTEVPLNLTTLLVMALIGLWLFWQVRQQKLALPTSRTTLPLLLFLLVNLLSLFISAVTWDPVVPRSNTFLLTQIAQWLIFVFSAAIFWLVPSFVNNKIWLQRIAFLFLAVGGGLLIVYVLSGINPINGSALFRSMFWPLLTALAGGQLLFNQQLCKQWQLFLLLCLGATLFHILTALAQDSASSLAGVVAVIIALVWLRLPRLRWPGLLVGLFLLGSGTLLPFVYEFAGGDARWFESGGARIALIERTIEVTMRNPITGLGPAAYRQYAAMTPLIYEHIVWFDPRVSSHNNYVDIFSQAGLLGLGIFLWFMGELVALGWRLHKYYRTGFAAGYVNSMLALWVSVMFIMMLADWLLPFVYNQHFAGFQASVLVWLFWGGLLTLERLQKEESLEQAKDLAQAV